MTLYEDSLPDRMLKEPMRDGAAQGEVVDLDCMPEQYYRLRGWDRKTGIPYEEKLRKLDLADIAI